MRIFCSYCGAANSTDARVCMACATPLVSSQPESAGQQDSQDTGSAAWPNPEGQPTEYAAAPEPSYGQPYPMAPYPPQQQYTPPPYPQEHYVPPPYPQAPGGAPPYPPQQPPYGGTPYGQQVPSWGYPPQPPPYGQPLAPAQPPQGTWPVYGQPLYPQQSAYGSGSSGQAPYPMVPGYGMGMVPSGPGSLASGLPRFGAFLFDSVVYLVVAFFMLAIAGALNLPAIVGSLMVLGLHPFYYIGFWSTTGRTPGYKAAGLQLIREDGTKPTMGSSVIRYVGWHITNLVFYLGCLWMIWDYKKQALYDKMAHTLVIRA